MRDKTALLDRARREASEAISFAERLTEEYCGLRGDLHQQVTLVAQRDEVIGRLRDEACTQWASGDLPFKGRLLMSIQTWTSTSTSLAMRRQRSPSSQTILENWVPPLRPTPLLHPLLLPLMSNFPRISSFACRRLFFFFWAWDPEHV